jgi:hypothetical protein
MESDGPSIPNPVKIDGDAETINDPVRLKESGSETRVALPPGFFSEK